MHTGRRTVGRVLLAAVVFMIAITVSLPVISQDKNRQRRPPKTSFSQAVAFNKDSVPPLTDSMKAVMDSIHLADSLFKIDSAALQKKSSLEMPAFSTGKDSTVEVFSNGQRKVFLYGDVTVKYKDM